MNNKLAILLLTMVSFTFCSNDDDPNVGANVGPDRTSDYDMVGEGDDETTARPDLYPEANPGDIYEWDRFGFPVQDRTLVEQQWVLNEELSDEFNYEFAASATETNFGDNGKWKNYYHQDWQGPAPTHWQYDHVWVEDGMLKIKVTRPDDAVLVRVESGEDWKNLPETYTGCISSTQLVEYPAFIEARAKLSNSTMASDVWMLSADATQEIDIIEAYGSDRSVGTSGNSFYGCKYLHLSHHVFDRSDPSNLLDYQPTMTQTWYRDNYNTTWREDYHRIGVYWRDATNIEYYIDGELVRVVSGMDIIDPKGYTDGTGLVEALHIIINMEDQSWRAIDGLSPTAAELTNEQNCIFNVDWIRVYKYNLE